jgi:competence protein ComEC
MQLEEGQAVFVDLPGERHDWLVDGGGTDGRRDLLPFLRSRGVDRLAGVLVTCKDKAHIAGLHRVLQEMPVRELVVADTESRSSPYRRWRHVAEASGVRTRRVRAGDSWSTAGMRFTALSPPANASWDRADDNALVLLLEYGGTRLLLLSAAGTSVEQQLQTNAAIIIKGHHGKEDSCAVEFLARVGPAVVVQSVGEWGRRRIDPELRERVEAVGATLLRTDETGAVTIRLTRAGYQIQTCRQAVR